MSPSSPDEGIGGPASCRARAILTAWVVLLLAPSHVTAAAPRLAPDLSAATHGHSESDDVDLPEDSARRSDGDSLDTPASNPSPVSSADRSDASPEAETSDAPGTTSSAESSSDAAASVTTVTESTGATPTRQPSGWMTDLELEGTFRHGRDLGEELERVEGLKVRRRSSLGQPAYVSIRGGSPRQLAVHLNGIPIGAPAGVGFDVGTLSTPAIDRVELYRGAAAAPWGSGALSGAMNLQMRPPERRGWRASGTMLGGSFGTYGIAADAAVGRENWSGDVAANWRHSRGDFEFRDRQGSLRRRINNGHDQLAAGASVGGEVAGGQLDGALFYEFVDRGAPGPSEFQESYRHARLRRHRTIATVDWNKRGIASPDWGVVDLEVGAGAVHRPTHYHNPESFLGTSTVDRRSTYSSFAVRSRASAYFDAGNFLYADLELRHQSYTANYSWEGDDGLASDRQTLSLGLSDELLLFDESLSLVAGLRADVVADRDRLRLPLVPSGGVIWRMTDAFRLKANISRSHRIPDFDELYLRTETIRGNPSLSPERAINADLGVALGDRSTPIRGAMTGWVSRVRDMILFLPQTAYLYRAQNLGPSTTAGLETTVSGRPIDRLRIRGAYTYTEAHLDSLPDLQLPQHPRHRGRLAVRAALGGWGPLVESEDLRATATVSARSRTNLDPFGNLSNPPFARLDMGATFRPTDAFTFGLRVKNVTNNRRGADYLQRPLPGRAFYASVRWRRGSLDADVDR